MYNIYRKRREVIDYEKKNIAALIVKTIIGIIILSCLIANLISLVNQLINGQILELIIGGVIGVGLAIAYNLLDREARK